MEKIKRIMSIMLIMIATAFLIYIANKSSIRQVNEKCHILVMDNSSISINGESGLNYFINYEDSVEFNHIKLSDIYFIHKNYLPNNEISKFKYGYFKVYSNTNTSLSRNKIITVYLTNGSDNLKLIDMDSTFQIGKEILCVYDENLTFKPIK